MTRAELVDATYDAAEKLNQSKLKHKRISNRRGKTVARRIQDARQLRARLAAGQGEASLQGEISRFSESTVCDKRELFWARHLINFKIFGMLETLGRYCFRRPKLPAAP
jgi:hypothetical protein